MNKLKLGKKKLLGFMTAGAIVVTMAGSYATWDQMEVKSTKNVTLRNPVTVSVSPDNYTYKESSVVGATDGLELTSDAITISASDVPENVKTKLDVAVNVYEKGTETAAVGVVGTVKNGNGTSTTTFNDATTAATGDQYTVVLKGADSTVVDLDKDVDVEVVGTLSVIE